MAGYDFTVEVRDATEDALLRQMLRGLQLRCRQRWVEVKYRRTADGYYVTVDGPLMNIQASRAPMAISLAAIADATEVPLPRPQRLRVGHRILQGYIRGAADVSASVHDAARQLEAMPASLLFDPVGEQPIQYRLDGLTDMMEAWLNGQATTEQALEELHAIAELTMGFVLGAEWDDRSFAAQAAEMVATKRLSAAQHDALIALKNRRRDVRHHLGTMAREELMDQLPSVLGAIRSIVARIGGP